MSFGQSDSEKKQDTNIQKTQGQIGDISSNAATRGDKSWKFFKQAATPVADYYKGILGGDRTAINEFLGPELSQISSTFGNERKAASDFTPRGGARASGNTDLATKEASTEANAILGARPQAAQALSGLAGLFGGQSLGQTSTALGGLGNSANIGFGLNKEQSDLRQQTAQLWQGIGSTAGEAAGGWLGGK